MIETGLNLETSVELKWSMRCVEKTWSNNVQPLSILFGEGFFLLNWAFCTSQSLPRNVALPFMDSGETRALSLDTCWDSNSMVSNCHTFGDRAEIEYLILMMKHDETPQGWLWYLRIQVGWTLFKSYQSTCSRALSLPRTRCPLWSWWKIGTRVTQPYSKLLWLYQVQSQKLKWLVELQRLWQAMIGAKSPRPWSLTKIPFSLQGSMLHFTWLGCFNIILQVILWEFKEPRDVIFLGVNWDTTYYHVSMRVGARYLELNTPQKLLDPMALKGGRSRWGKFGTL